MSEMTDKDKEIKTALIKSIQSILDANKLNDYCCQYWLSDKIKEQFKLHEIYDWNIINYRNYINILFLNKT